MATLTLATAISLAGRDMAWLRQQAGDGAQLVQAQTVNYGISVQDAEHICLKLMKEYLERYSQEAFEVAGKRVEEFAVNFLTELNKQAPEAISNLKDPGVQSAVLDAEVGFAKSGDEQLGEVLVEMLVARTLETERNVKQLALNEGIAVAQRLTSKHLAALSLLFFFKNVQVNPPTAEDFKERVKALLPPMCADFRSFTESDSQYLVATGCAVRSIGTISWQSIMKQRYPGLYHRGFRPEETPSMDEILNGLENPGAAAILFESAEDGFFKVNAISEEGARVIGSTVGLTENAPLLELMKHNPIPDVEITDSVKRDIPELLDFLEAWSTLGFDGLDVSLTGIAVAYANFKRLTKEAFNAKIDVWIS
ncbi:LPO_1073/Vpar_1526 family protein [Streptomyces sp. NBC_00564]|uniref:LPO_1073/Vpar_1526 family protein n=1 Tax=Streptomyces sp. NBC_00564 TaxID=2903663 RepID=UPI00352C4CA1|nr:hypothetical protein OG256_24130 [Streptomyces sp. NBC_00564]